MPVVRSAAIQRLFHVAISFARPVALSAALWRLFHDVFSFALPVALSAALSALGWRIFIYFSVGPAFLCPLVSMLLLRPLLLRSRPPKKPTEVIAAGGRILQLSVC
jgi:hypothetical protein